MKHTRPIRTLFLLLVSALTGLSGCSTPKPRPLDQDELASYFKTARDPRFFWLTVYEGRDGPVITGGNRTHDSQAARLYWQNGNRSPQPFVEVQNHKGAYLTALLDFTTAPSYSSFEGSALLGARPVGPPVFERQARHVIDDGRCFLTVVPKIRFENLHIENALVYTRAFTGDAGPLMRTTDKRSIDLIVGADLMMQLSFVHLNFGKKYTVMASTREYPLERTDLIASTPYSLVNGLPEVTAWVEGQEFPLLIDPAGDFALALQDVPNEPVRQLMIGDLVFREVAVTNFAAVGIPQGSKPRLGRQAIDKYTLTLDMKRGAWHWEKPND